MHRDVLTFVFMWRTEGLTWFSAELVCGGKVSLTLQQDI